MNAVDVMEKQKVGVIFVKEGSCQGWLKPTVDGVRSLLYEISAEAGVPILLKEITAQDAINGALPAHIVAQGWEYFYRMSYGMIPGIIINGKIISVGQPDRNVLKEALLNASQVKSTNS